MAISLQKLCDTAICYNLETMFYCKPNEICCTSDEMQNLIENGLSLGDFIEIPKIKHSEISKSFLMYKNVHRYRMRKISDMKDKELERVCHWYYEENSLLDEWREFETNEISNIMTNWCENNGIKYRSKFL